MWKAFAVLYLVNLGIYKATRVKSEFNHWYMIEIGAFLYL